MNYALPNIWDTLKFIINYANFIAILFATQLDLLTLSWATSFTPYQTEDNNFKFDENGGKFSKRVENTVENGEIVPYDFFFFNFPMFSKDL